MHSWVFRHHLAGTGTGAELPCPSTLAFGLGVSTTRGSLLAVERRSQICTERTTSANCACHVTFRYSFLSGTHLDIRLSQTDHVLVDFLHNQILNLEPLLLLVLTLFRV